MDKNILKDKYMNLVKTNFLIIVKEKRVKFKKPLKLFNYKKEISISAFIEFIESHSLRNKKTNINIHGMERFISTNKLLFKQDFKENFLLEINFTKKFSGRFLGKIKVFSFKKTKEINIVDLYIPQETNFNEIKNSLLNLERYDTGSFAILFFQDNHYYKSYKFFILNYIKLVFPLNEETKLSFLETKDQRLYLFSNLPLEIFKERLKIINFFFLTNFKLDIFNRIFSNSFNDENLIQSLEEESICFALKIQNSSLMISKHIIKSLRANINLEISEFSDDFKKLIIIETKTQYKENEYLELTIDINKKTLFYIFWKDLEFAYKLFRELLLKANEIAQHESNIKNIIVSLPSIFFIFLESKMYLDSKIIINLNPSDLEDINLNIGNIFENIFEITNSSIPISLEYFKNDYLSSNFEQFGFKNILIRRGIYTNLSREFDINYEINLIEKKVNFFNKNLIII